MATINSGFSAAKIVTALALGYGCSLAWVIYADIVYNNNVPLEAFEFHGLYPLGLGLSAIVTAFIFDRNMKSIGFSKVKPRFLISAIFIAALLLAFPFLLNLLLGFTTLNAAPKIDMEFIQIGLPVLVILAIGEEVMWRGILYDELCKRYSFISTSLIIGGFWVLWHLPVIIHTKFIYADRPLWFTLIFFSINVISLSFVYNYLRKVSNSLWPCVVLHAFTNYFVFVCILPFEQDISSMFFVNDIGVLYVLTNAGAAVWVISRIRARATIETK